MTSQPGSAVRGRSLGRFDEIGDVAEKPSVLTLQGQGYEDTHNIRPPQIEAPETPMIRNKRTTFATCVETSNAPGIHRTVPRLAGPIDDDERQFHFPTETPECLRRRNVLPNAKSTHQRRM